MQTNTLPAYDADDNPTGCCPRFNPQGWDDQELHFTDKLFVKAKTRSDQYVPIDMGPVFQETFAAIEKAGAYDDKNTLVLSRDVSPSQAEHYFAVTKPVPGQEMAHLTGDYLTRVFEGPYEDLPGWEQQFRTGIKGRGLEAGKVFYFYTTCPQCAQAHGKNYVVAVAELAQGGEVSH